MQINESEQDSAVIFAYFVSLIVSIWPCTVVSWFRSPHEELKVEHADDGVDGGQSAHLIGHAVDIVLDPDQNVSAFIDLVSQNPRLRAQWIRNHIHVELVTHTNVTLVMLS